MRDGSLLGLIDLGPNGWQESGGIHAGPFRLLPGIHRESDEGKQQTQPEAH
jgi:hypothetical protein